MTPDAAPFVWYELLTDDIDAALSFYAAVLGWQPRPFAADPRYDIVQADDRAVGGVRILPAGMTQPFWLGYVGTPDVDAAADRFAAAGGAIRRPPWDIPTVGRIAIVSDPQGGGIGLLQSERDGPSPAFDQSRPGHGQWQELTVADPDAAFAFYAGQFGWTRGRTVPMGPMGDYQLFQADGADIGGMMRAPDGAAGWTYYFGVLDIHAAAARITDNGGTIRHGPAEVPGGAFVIQAVDPQGARFAVVGSAARPA